MLCARRADFTAIGISGGHCTPERLTAAGATAVIDQLDELLPLLESPLQ
jgi:phosphoglycolate phosphatase-like HAD superfamily hydrolase